MSKAIDFEPMQQFLTDTIEPLEMAKQLDELENDYAIYVIDNPNGPNKQDSKRLYYLRQLRNVLLKMVDCPLVK